MIKLNIPRVVIAGTSSGVGKTTIVAGLLAVLKLQGLSIQSFKIGPDYIDPGFHRIASGKEAHNLDSWLIPANEISGLFARTAVGNDIVVIEGVMGLYDGGQSGISSTAAIAKELAAPVILVVDARSAGESVAATVLGFKMYDPAVNLAGVIVNRLGSASHKAIVAESLGKIGIPVVGYVQRNEAFTVPERHLGLTPVTETNAKDAVSAIAAAISRNIGIDELLAIARSAPPIVLTAPQNAPAGKSVRIGVAQDEGFSFYYPESLAVLEELGAEIVPFSPLRDTKLPQVNGLIFGGGFPEMFLDELAANTAMHAAIRAAIADGMPVYAECGGLMYLSRQIIGFDGRRFPMVGIVPAVSAMQSRLQTVGYVEATALEDNVLCASGEKLRGHEFHFSSIEPDSSEGSFAWAFQIEKRRTGEKYLGGYALNNVLASYLHMHFAGNRNAAARFIAKCKTYPASEGVSA
jgi:cobyrinic acid a,c-diamide synthase